MAPISPKLRSRLPAWALRALVCALPALAGAGLPDFSGLPVSVDAASSEVDYRTNTVVFRNVVITQGTMRVSAEYARATGLNFANSRWNFEGNVRIDSGQRGNLRSDQAIVEFRDSHIARATITGKPAEFEQQRANSEQIARGHADQILYDIDDGTVRLTNDAWLSDGQNEISGPVLIYNIREQQIQAATTAPDAGVTDQRVHISIAPHTLTAPKPEAPKPEAPKPEAPKPEAPKPEAGKNQPQQPAPTPTPDSPPHS